MSEDEPGVGRYRWLQVLVATGLAMALIYGLSLTLWASSQAGSSAPFEAALAFGGAAVAFVAASALTAYRRRRAPVSEQGAELANLAAEAAVANAMRNAHDRAVLVREVLAREKGKREVAGR